MADLPGSAADFSAAYGSADDPEVAAEGFFAAVYVYTHVDSDAGSDMLDEIMVTSNWDKTHPGLAKALDETPWVFDSYEASSDPDDGYEGIDVNSFELDVANVATTETDLLGVGELAAVYLHSSGGDQANPLILRNVDGAWKVACETPLLFGLQSTDGHPGNDIAATEDIADTMHLFLEGVYLYILGFEDIGWDVMRGLQPSDGYESDIEKLTRKTKEKPYVFYSYAQGTGPDDGYTGFDPFDFRINVPRVDDADNMGQKAFVECSGADTDRPYRCKITKRDQYRMFEFSTLRVDVRPPTEEEW